MMSGGAGSGFFISFEGGEGTGKSTQVRRLRALLEESGLSVLTTREPGGTEEGERIRALLARRDGGDWTPMAECLLFYAARTMHVERVIRPALQAGRVVITDRFSDSTRAYQSGGHGVDPGALDRLDDLAIGGFTPDLTFILDLDPAEGLRRATRRIAADGSGEDRFEALDLSFHERLRQAFLAIARRFPQRCVIIDAGGSEDEVAQAIAAVVRERIGHG